MGDEEHRHAAAGAAAQHFDDLAARRGVLHRGRFVAEQQLGIEHQGARKFDALALSAGEADGARGEYPLSGEANLGEQFFRAFEAFLFRSFYPRDYLRLHHRVDDRQPWRYRAVGVLRHVAAAAAQAVELRRCDLRRVSAEERHAAGGGGNERHHRAQQGALAAARLADDR